MNEQLTERILDKLDRIYDQQAKQGESLARLEERFAAHEGKLDEHETEDEKMRTKIDELYKFKWTLLGVISAVSFAFSYIVDWLRGSQ